MKLTIFWILFIGTIGIIGGYFIGYNIEEHSSTNEEDYDINGTWERVELSVSGNMGLCRIIGTPFFKTATKMVEQDCHNYIMNDSGCFTYYNCSSDIYALVTTDEGGKK